MASGAVRARSQSSLFSISVERKRVICKVYVRSRKERRLSLRISASKDQCDVVFGSALVASSVVKTSSRGVGRWVIVLCRDQSAAACVLLHNTQL